LKAEQSEQRELVPSSYSYTPAQADRILDITLTMLEALDQPPESLTEATKMIVLLQVVTGRRFNEIASTLSMAPVPGFPYQATVLGLLKSFALTSSLPCRIPLLMEFSIVVRVLALIRQFTEGERITNARVSKASVSLYGVPLTHTLIRNLYLHLAYQHRGVNGYYPTASRSFFDTRALGHASSATIPYQRQTFT
jgi:hypothetical protein